MPDEQLADALGRLPNGFPRTPSNAEIPLLQKIFPPERASLAALLSDELKLPSEVAERAGVPAEAAEAALKHLKDRTGCVGGIIVVDRWGGLGIAHTTKYMCHARMTEGLSEPIVVT